MSKRSEITEVVLEMIEELKAVKQQAEKNREIRFMHEKVSLQTLKDRFAKMTPEGRKAFRERIGIDAMIEMLRGGKDNNAP